MRRSLNHTNVPSDAKAHIFRS